MNRKDICSWNALKAKKGVYFKKGSANSYKNFNQIRIKRPLGGSYAIGGVSKRNVTRDAAPTTEK